MFNFITGAILIASISICVWIPTEIYYTSFALSMLFLILGGLNGGLLYRFLFTEEMIDQEPEIVVEEYSKTDKGERRMRASKIIDAELN